MTQPNKLPAYKGIDCFYDEDGYSGCGGPSQNFGFCETLAELHAEIDDYWQGDEHGPLNGIFDDEEPEDARDSALDSQGYSF